MLFSAAIVCKEMILKQHVNLIMLRNTCFDLIAVPPPSKGVIPCLDSINFDFSLGCRCFYSTLYLTSGIGIQTISLQLASCSYILQAGAAANRKCS